MFNNKNLNKARVNKNDEFYTLYDDIAKEISQYDKSEFENKIVYCNCDDYRFSNFVKYFKDNFSNLGLKELIATNYDIGEGAFKYSYNGIKEEITPLKGIGDFSSDECVAILEKSDLIITNPPFSLFRKFIDLIISKEKKFLVIGLILAIQYNEVFKYFLKGKLRLGYHSKSMIFSLGNDVKDINARFFTNFEVINKKTKKPKQDYFKMSYETYHNCQAIEVPRVDLIPFNFEGVMGVPITYFDYFDYETFEIVGIGKSVFFNKSFNYLNSYRVDKNKKTKHNITNSKLTLLRATEPKKAYYIAENVEGYLLIPYTRLLIRKKNV